MERKWPDIACPKWVHALFLILLPPSFLFILFHPLCCTNSPTRFLFLSAALCWLFGYFLVPIRLIALCFHQTEHLSYHCLDNCLLVQKSLWALCSHGDDMVTLPSLCELPAETVDPFPFLLTHCFSLCLPLCPSFCSSFGSAPHFPGASNSLMLSACLCVFVSSQAHSCTTDGKFSCVFVNLCAYLLVWMFCVMTSGDQGGENRHLIKLWVYRLNMCGFCFALCAYIKSNLVYILIRGSFELNCGKIS